MDTHTTAPDPNSTEFGDVPVDSGRILLVDPCHLPDDLVARLTTPNAYGVTVALVVGTPMGDGPYCVVGAPGELTILDPWADYDDETGELVGSGWKHDSTRLVTAL